jgi:hypothetical protein
VITAVMFVPGPDPNASVGVNDWRLIGLSRTWHVCPEATAEMGKAFEAVCNALRDAGKGEVVREPLRKQGGT